SAEFEGQKTMHFARLRRPTLITVILGLAAATAATAPWAHAARRTAHLSPGTWCGGVLWRDLNLSAADRGKVSGGSEATTISKIAALSPPGRISKARTTAFARTSWHLHAVVDRYRIASNGEIVLILFSIDSGQYMNAYLSNPHCLSAKTRWRTSIVAARK